jgi:hypothetical protein
MPPFNTPTWKQLLIRLGGNCEFKAPATESQLATIQRALGVTLPEQLREILLESDGITADYDAGLVWSASDIVSRNREFRTFVDFRELYMPFEHLLFFGDNGGGDQFAFAIHADGQIHKREIFRWEHETDARSWFAGHLEQFFEFRLRKMPGLDLQ